MAHTISEPRIEYRDAQPYAAIKSLATMDQPDATQWRCTTGTPTG